MSHSHEALYRAICAHPDEDTPRLAYADLIEEEGDGCPHAPPGAAAVRAAFIRNQIALSRVDECDPSHISTRQLNPDVLTGWGMAHTLPRVPGGFGWEKFEFRRGFPWKVGVISLEAFVDDGDGLFDAAPIQALEVDARNRPDLAALADWPHLRRIRRLEFSLARFGPDGLHRLGNSPHASDIAEMTFEYDGITAEGLEALARSDVFPQLSVLELRSNVIPPVLLVDALDAAAESSLSRLSLTANRLTHVEAAGLTALSVMQGVSVLDLSDNPDLGPDAARALVDSGLISRLRMLNLSNTRPGRKGVRELAQVSGPIALQSLDLSANRLGPVAVKSLVESPLAGGLRILNLANNALLDDGAETLASAPALAGLLELNLGDAGLTDIGALALAQSPYLGGLLRLDLTCRESEQPFSGKIRRALVERFGRRVSC